MEYKKMVASIRLLTKTDYAVKYFYYTEKNLEAGSAWHQSRAIEILGLKAIKKKDLEAVLTGKIGNAELGKRTKDGIKHRPGYDLTFSAPKSVSIMALVADDKRIMEAHAIAVGKTLDYLQSNLIHTRVQKDGKIVVEQTDNAIIAKYTHITSRPSKADDIPDPNLHTHCIIINATLCDDGTWRCIVSDSLYENKMLLGEIYRLELINELIKLGYEIEITDTKHFTFEIKGVPSELIEEFSRRRKEILQEAEKRGIKDAAGLAQIAINTRSSKKSYSIAELKRNWKSRAGKLDQLIKEPKEEKEPDVNLTKEEILDLALNYAIKHNSSREAVFTVEILLTSMLERLAEFIGIYQIEFSDITTTVATAIKEGKLLAKENELTTPENIKAEKRTIKLMQSMLGKVRPILPKYKVMEHLKKTNSLNLSQKEAVTLALTTNDRVIGIQGSAGTLKSTTLDVIGAMAPLICLAPTKAAVRALKNHKAHTLSYFLRKFDGVIHKRGTSEALGRLKANFKDKLVVLDEASLASTDQINKLLQLTKILKFRLLMVGDYRQLGAIPSGKPFYYLQNHGMNTCVMGEIKRQRNEELLKNVYLAESAVDKKSLYAGNIIERIIKNLEENVIDVSKRKDETDDLATATYRTWLSLKDKDPLIVVPAHYLRKEINAKIRPHFIQGDDRRTNILFRKDMTPARMKYAKYYRKGDILRFGKEKPSIGLEAGSYLKVLDVQKDTLILSGGKEIKAQDLEVENLEVYTEEDMPIAVGDRIRWTRNSQRHDFIVNGKVFVVKVIKDDVIEFETESGIHSISLSDPDMWHIDYDYTTTVYGVQGRSSNHVIGVLSYKMYMDLISQRAFYVILSRAKHGVTLVVDDAGKVIGRIAASTGAKTSALEHQYAIEGTDISKLNKEYFDVKEKLANKYGSVQKSDFLTNKDLLIDVAKSLFGPPIDLEVNRLIFDTEFKFKNDEHDYWHNNIVSLDMETGKYYRLNNIDMEDEEGDHLYNLAEDAGIVELYSDEQTKRIEYIQKLYSQSKPIRGTIAEQYLIKHRKIDTQAFEFSDDVRFIAKAYSSETKSYHPALFVGGRDKNQNLRSAQLIYLDPKTHNKSKLDTAKRSIGVVKGSIIDLTPNKDAKDVFIAEGIETALSIAQVRPDARVMVSFGSSNLQHIDTGQSNNVILCADNDGKASISRFVVEDAARALIRSGKTVTVITPDLISGKEKADFNDALKVYGPKKVNEYVLPAITKGLNYRKPITKLEQSIIHAEKKILESTKKIGKLNLFKDTKAAIQKISESTKSPKEILKALKATPETFGELNTSDLSKAKNIAKQAGTLITNNKLLKAHQAALEPLKAKIDLRIDTKNKSIAELEQALEKEVFKLLKITDNKCDFDSVKKVTLKVLDQIVDCRERFGKDPTKKTEFFLRARYELERESYIRNKLSKLYSSTTAHKMLLTERIDRALSVDSRLANKDSIYYKPASIAAIRSALKQGDEKISYIAQNLSTKGIDCSVKAEFMAKEIVKYEEKHGTHMPSNHREFIESIGNYVSRGYQKLCNQNLNSAEASRIMHNEGVRLATHRRMSELSPISTQAMKQIQSESKDFYLNAKVEHTSAKINTGRGLSSKSMELEM